MKRRANSPQRPSAPIRVGRYAMYEEIASGGLASVHLARLVGPGGFSRICAMKRLHPPMARDIDTRRMFLDEARLAARIRHPNVVSVLDVVEDCDELYLVMDYVHGGSLAELLRAAGGRIPEAVAVAIVVNTLRGLDGAHRLTDQNGQPLKLVHRDVSPQNILVGLDGVALIADFGIAKAAARLHTTREGQLKGKIAYMSPEQLRAGPVDARSDVFAAGTVAWECLTGLRLFRTDDDVASTVLRVVEGPIPRISERRPELSSAISDVVACALERNPDQRHASAAAFADALEEAVTPARPTQVAAWVESLLGEQLALRRDRILEIERDDGAITSAPVSESKAPPVSEPSAPVMATAAAAVSPARPVLWLGLVIAAAAMLGLAVLALGMSRGEPPGRLATGLAALELTLPSPAPPASSEPSEPTAKPAPRAAKASRATPPVKPQAKNCSPPYILRADGTKQFKPECF